MLKEKKTRIEIYINFGFEIYFIGSNEAKYLQLIVAEKESRQCFIYLELNFS